VRRGRAEMAIKKPSTLFVYYTYSRQRLLVVIHGRHTARTGARSSAGPALG